MANAEIVVAGTEELPILASMYNEVFRPPRDEQFFRRRFLGRHNLLFLLAAVERRPVGFAVGFELKPSTFYSWLAGVVPEMRRQGVARQLLEAQHAWAIEHGYTYIRMECHNAQRPVMHLAIALGYDVAGLRWDMDRQVNQIIYEKALSDLPTSDTEE